MRRTTKVSPRVLIIDGAGNLWGSERSLLDLISATGHEDVAVCCPPRTPLAAELKRRGVRTFPYFVRGLHDEGKMHRLWAALGVFRASLEFSADVIHLNQSGSFRVALPACITLNLGLIAHVRIFEDVEYLARLRPKHRSVSAIIAISKAIESEVANAEPLKYIHCHQLYDTYVPFERGLGSPSRQTKIACVGRAVPIKGQNLLVEALGILKLAGKDVECVMLGSGDDMFMSRLRLLAAELHVDRQIEWIDFAINVSVHLKDCAFLVCPSHLEPLGRVILEAWDLGLVPIAFSGSGGAAEVILSANGGIIYNEQSAESLADALMAAFSLSPAECEAYVQRGRAWISNNCDSKAYAEALRLIWRAAAL